MPQGKKIAITARVGKGMFEILLANYQVSKSYVDQKRRNRSNDNGGLASMVSNDFAGMYEDEINVKD